MLCPLPLVFILAIADSRSTTTAEPTEGEVFDEEVRNLAVANGTLDEPAAGLAGLTVKEGPATGGGSTFGTLLGLGALGAAGAGAAGYYYKKTTYETYTVEYDEEFLDTADIEGRHDFVEYAGDEFYDQPGEEYDE